jgi:hypothetical protein
MDQCQIQQREGYQCFTFCIEDLYREAEPILCPYITDDDIDVFCFSGTGVILWFIVCLLCRNFIIVRPDLSCMLARDVIKIKDNTYIPPGFFCLVLGGMSSPLLAVETHTITYLRIIQLLRP